jgi:hypothetical protein
MRLIAPNVYAWETPRTPEYRGSRAGEYTSVYTAQRYENYKLALKMAEDRRDLKIKVYLESVNSLDRQIQAKQKLIADIAEDSARAADALEKNNADIKNEKARFDAAEANTRARQAAGTVSRSESVRTGSARYGSKASSDQITNVLKGFPTAEQESIKKAVNGVISNNKITSWEDAVSALNVALSGGSKTKAGRSAALEYLKNEWVIFKRPGYESIIKEQEALIQQGEEAGTTSTVSSSRPGAIGAAKDYDPTLVTGEEAAKIRKDSLDKLDAELKALELEKKELDATKQQILDYDIIDESRKIYKDKYESQQYPIYKTIQQKRKISAMSNWLDRRANEILVIMGNWYGSEEENKRQALEQAKRELGEMLSGSDKKEKEEDKKKEEESTGRNDSIPKTEKAVATKTVDQKDKQARLDSVISASKLTEQPKKAERLASNTDYGTTVKALVSANSVAGEKKKTTKELQDQVIAHYNGDPEKQRKAIELLNTLILLEDRATKLS